MKKRGLVALSFLLVCVFILTGCAHSPSASSDQPEKIKIEVMRRGSGLPASDDDIIKKALDEALDIDLQLSLQGNDTDYFNQLSVRLASNNPPDLFWVNSTNLKNYAAKGYLLDLTNYYDNELKQTAEWLGETTMKLSWANGKKYGIPNPSTFPYRTMWVRTDWLDNLKLDIPTDVDSLFDVAKAFTFNDPDGNGKADTVGISGMGFTTFSNIFGAYGIPGPTAFYMKNGVLTHSLYDPDMPEALAKIHEFIAAGVVDPEIFGTQTEPNLADKAFQNKVGLVDINWSNFAKDEHIEQMAAGDPNAKWEQMYPVGEFDGGWDIGTTGHIFAMPVSLEKDSGKLQRIFDLLNFLCSPDGSNIVSYGIEGDTFEIKDGKVVKLESDNWKNIGHVWLYQFTGRPDELEYLGIRFPNQLPVIEFAKNQPRKETLNGFVSIPEGYNPADADRYIEEELIKFIYGRKSLDEYPDFLNTLEETFNFTMLLEQAKKDIAAIE